MRFLPSLVVLGLAAGGQLFAQTSVVQPIPAVGIFADRAATTDLRAFFAENTVSGNALRFTTVAGEFYVQLNDAAAPKTVANFLTYVNARSFTNSLIHRSVPGFIIQGGGFYPASTDGTTFTGYNLVPTNAPLALETTDTLPNALGTIAMARTNNLNSATSGWFINTADNTSGLPSASNSGYAVFGNVIGSGMTVVNALAADPVLNGTVTVTSSSTSAQLVTVNGATLPASFGPGWGLLGAAVTSVNGNFVSLAINANETITSSTSKPTTLFLSPFDELPVRNNLALGQTGSVNLNNLVMVSDITPVFPSQAGGPSLATFSVSSSNPLVSGSISGSTLHLAATKNLTGTSTVTVTVTDTGGSSSNSSFAVGTTRRVVDFNSDSIPDIVLQYPGGSVGAWSPDVSGAFKRWMPFNNGASFGGWVVVGVADFTGDGVPDLLLQYPGGSMGIWSPDATGAFSAWIPLNNGGSIGGWTAAGVGDFNGDGIPDVLLKYPGGYLGAWCPGTTGTLKQWLPLNNGASLGGWTVAAVTESNGDGIPDLVLQYPGGYVGIWSPDASGVLKRWLPFFGGKSFGTATVVGASDFNGDGIPDLVLQYPGGYLGVWCADATGAFTQWIPLNNNAPFAPWNVVH